MFSYECVFAALLLSGSSEENLPMETHSWTQACRPTILTMALHSQILDSREAVKYFSQECNFASEWKNLQNRFDELAFAPLVEEAQQFPSRQIINDYLAQNRAFRNDLQTRMALDLIQREYLQMVLEETDQLYQLWDTIRDARCDYYYITVRRQALQTLLNKVGPEVYYSNRFAPPLPIWRFPQWN